MGTKTPPFKEYEKWTTSRFFSFIRSSLRRSFTRWPPKYEAVERAKRLKPKGNVGRHRFEYQCSECKKYYARKEVEVDHIVPAGSLKSFDDLGGFAERLFVSADKLRLLCKSCHYKVTHNG